MTNIPDGRIKRMMVVAAFQAALCAVESYLVLKISLIGRIGIALIHREYRLLRSGWKTFLLFFFIQLLVIASLEVVQRKAGRRALVYTAAGLISVALIGLIVTYLDFLHTYSHRLLKERFHLGFYLFWLGWMGSCIVYLADKKPISSGVKNPIDRAESEPAAGRYYERDIAAK